MLLGTLAASWVENLLTGKGRAGEDTIRGGQDF